MKSLKNIANTILERRMRMTHVILPGDITAAIGSEGLQEALNRRWLVPDMDVGALKVNDNQTIVEEMNRIIEAKCEKCGKDECECDGVPEKKKEESKTVGPRAFVMDHTRRLHLHEMNTPGLGDTGARPNPPIQPPMNSPTDAGRSQEHQVGQDVVIAEEGRTYMAKVKSKNPDGTYSLSFGQNRPPVERPYKKEEMQTVQPNDVQLVR